MSVTHYTGGLVYQKGRGSVAVAARHPVCGIRRWDQSSAVTETWQTTCGRCLRLIELSERPKVLRLTRADARREVLSQAAAFLNHWRVGSYEGDRIEEDSDESGEAYDLLNDERVRLVQRLHKQSGVGGDVGAWDPEL